MKLSADILNKNDITKNENISNLYKRVHISHNVQLYLVNPTLH